MRVAGTTRIFWRWNQAKFLVWVVGRKLDGWNPHSEATGLMQRQRLTARATGKILGLAPANKSLSAFRSVTFHVSFACKASPFHFLSISPTEYDL